MTASQDAAELAQVRRRSEVSTLFIGFLIAVAIAEAVKPVRDSVNANGFNVFSIALFAIFLMTVIRFFIGFQLHLMNERLLSMKGNVWFFDFCIIIFETMILIFLAGECTLEQSNQARYKFFEVLVWVLLADFAWAIVQKALAATLAGWDRKIVWGWGVSGAVLTMIVIATKVTVDVYSQIGLWVMLLVNGLAFLVDLKIIDDYGLFRKTTEAKLPRIFNKPA